MTSRAGMFVCALLALGLAPAVAFAQGCPQGQVLLSIAPASPVPSGTPLMVTVTGTPGASITLFQASSLGQTTLGGPGPLAGTVICLSPPFYPMPLGMLPPSGTKTVPVPTSPAAPAGSMRHYQAVEMAFSPTGPAVDTSNPVGVTFSGPPPCTPGTVQLTITPSNPAPGTPLSVAVTGTPGAFTLLFRGATQGSAIVPPPGPFVGTVICLNAPFSQMPLGQIPPSGTLNVMLPTPLGPAGTTLHYQAGTVVPGMPSPTVDTSNVASITLSGPPPCVAGNVLLDIQPDTPVQPGSTVTINVTGTPGALVILASGPHLGSTALPFANLSLCLSWPLNFRLLGLIPAAGTLTETHQVPPNVMFPSTLTIHFQAVEVQASGSTLVFDTSNLDTLIF